MLWDIRALMKPALSVIDTLPIESAVSPRSWMAALVISTERQPFSAKPLSSGNFLLSPTK